MRRILILLLAVVIPLKAWAGVAHALTLNISHDGSHASVQHAGTAGAQSAHHQAAADDCCATDEAGAALHSHECPHLTMPLFAASAPLTGIAGIPTATPITPTQRLSSVVLDVLLQPPLPLL